MPDTVLNHDECPEQVNQVILDWIDRCLTDTTVLSLYSLLPYLTLYVLRNNSEQRVVGNNCFKIDVGTKPS